MIDVIIPARNEEYTLFNIVHAFQCDAQTGTVIVVNDQSDDFTASVAASAGAHVVTGPGLGKGQAVQRGLNFAETDRVILCDADYEGFRREHASILTHYNLSFPGMVRGVTDFVQIPPWPVSHKIYNLVTGVRIVPTEFLRGIDLHGYCMEVQINKAALDQGMEVRELKLPGVRNAKRWSRRRHDDMMRDQIWLQGQIEKESQS